MGPTDHPFPRARSLASGRPDENDWVKALDENGFQVGLERYWLGPYTYAAAEVLRFGSHEGALGFQHWIIHTSCVNATRAFAVESMRGSIGLQLIWGVHDVSEQVSFVRGPYRYLVSVRTGQAPLPWWIVDETTRLGVALGIPMSRDRTPCTGVEGRLAKIDRRATGKTARAPTTLDPEQFLPARPGGPLNASVGDPPTTQTTFDPVPSGIRDEFDQEWRERLAAAAFRDGARRHWTLSDGEAVVTIEVFATHQGASAYQDWVTANVTCSLAVDTFEPENIAAPGFRVLLGADLHGDEISFVRGNVRIEVVTSSTDGADDDHTRVEALARIADRAVARAMTFEER